MASKKEYRFACLIPSYNEGDYWEEIYKGFIDAAESIQFASVSLDIHFYDQTDVQSFRNECTEIIQRLPSGVIMNAVFKDAVIEFANQLKSLEQVEDHRARISLDMVCEFMREVPDELSTKDIPLLAFQQWIGTKILSPGGNAEYEKYKKKYRKLKKPS